MFGSRAGGVAAARHLTAPTAALREKQSRYSSARPISGLVEVVDVRGVCQSVADDRVGFDFYEPPRIQEPMDDDEA